MNTSNISKVYAKSLLELGDEKNIKIVDELTTLTDIINHNNQLENVLFLDVFTHDEKKAVFADLAKKAAFNPLVVETVNFLIEEGRIGLLPMIVKEAIVYDDDRKGFLKGTIEGFQTSIPDNVKEQIKSFLKAKLGREPQLTYVHNTNLSAGYKITVEDLQLDASLDNQLNQLKNTIVTE